MSTYRVVVGIAFICGCGTAVGRDDALFTRATDNLPADQTCEIAAARCTEAAKTCSARSCPEVSLKKSEFEATLVTCAEAAAQVECKEAGQASRGEVVVPAPADDLKKCKSENTALLKRATAAEARVAALEFALTRIRALSLELSPTSVDSSKAAIQKVVDDTRK